MVLGGLLACSLGVLAYPTPEQAGFHHCALIYDKPTRDADDLSLYVAHQVDGQPRGWLFDAYLFLLYTTPSGRRTENGDTVRADWQAHLDTWFAPGRDLHALDEAIERASQVLGPPPAKRQVILSIPWPSPKVTDFGDVDGDGQSEDLSRAEDVDKVLDWYLSEARHRFEAAGFRHLAWWGGYWMNEGVDPIDRRNCQAAAHWLHEAGLKFLWIPYYRAAGWQSWRELGFDVALLQPNYAFWEQHQGATWRNRLQVTAELAKAAGLGVEVELSAMGNRPPGPLYWRHYLRDGAADRGGYQQAATAYYLGSASLERLARVNDPLATAMYADLAAYVAGQPIAEPDAPTAWTTLDGQPLRGLDPGGWATGQPLAAAQALFGEPRQVADLAIYLDQPEGSEPWHGLARVEVLPAGGGDWLPAGWALRGKPDERDLTHQVMAVPVGQEAAGLRVRLEGQDGAVAMVTGLAPFDRGLLPPSDNLALDRPYTVEPAEPGVYPDRGGQLNDGLLSERGYSDGRCVGWRGRSVAVTFDLGAPKPVSEVVAHLQGGGTAGVNFPSQAVLLTAQEAPPPPQLAGHGAWPDGGHWAPPEPMVIDQRQADDDLLGHLSFKLPAGTSARYVTLVMTPLGHLMLSEVEVLSDGLNVARQATYQTSPAPTPAETVLYADDGRRLTSGRIATHYRQGVTGWWGEEPHTITVDLGALEALREVTLWSLASREAGITGLASVEVELSDDGLTWRSAGRAESGQAPAELAGAEPYRAPLTGRARFVRLRIGGGGGWALISALQVR